MRYMKRAIIVERDTDICDGMKAIMEEGPDWKVDCVKSIEAARPLLYCNYYDLIILDYLLSKTEGGKEIVYQFHSKIVLLSSYKNAKSEYSSLDVKVLHMPFNIDEFIQVIQM